MLPDGGLLVAEEGTGEDDLSAGVSLITPEGDVGRLISGLPSGRDSGDLSGVPLVGVSPDGATLYIGNFNAQHLWTLPLNADKPLGIPDKPYTPDDLGVALERLNNVYVLNPFDITFDANGAPIVTDASGNGVAQENSDGTTRFFHRFDSHIDPTNERLTIDPVPTGIARICGEYYVTLLGGCPYPARSGELVAVDERRNQRTVIDNLNMPIDVAQDANGDIWVLEFAKFADGASCFSGEGYTPESGRLSRITPDGGLETTLDGLDFPGAVLPMPDGTVYISEVFAGRILRVTLDGGSAQSTDITFRVLTSNAPHWRFRNVADAVGLHFEHGAFHVRATPDHIAGMGAGLCWIDYDNDGWLDLYLVNSYAEQERSYWEAQGGFPRNALYRNEHGVFRDVSEESGTDLQMRGNGCVAADFNGDGWIDLYVTADGANALLWNRGDGTFDEGAKQSGVAAIEWNSAAVVGDLNGDGLVDLFVGGYINLDNRVPNPTGAFPQDYYGIPDRLYINEGLDVSGRSIFREVTREAGLFRDERALGAILSDLDNDGDLDLYIANDGQANRLYENEPMPDDPEGIGFRFVDTHETAKVGDTGSGMGIAEGDFNGDGQFDLLVTNWERELNALYRNQTIEQGYLNFEYDTFHIGMMGLGNNLTGWGTAMADFDQDGDDDLLTVNGRIPVTNLATDAELVRFYGNRSVEGFPTEYREWTEQVGLEALGTLNARGAAVADYDNDGDLDIAINTIGSNPVLLSNEFAPGNWLQIALDIFASGAVVTITLPDGRQLRREVHAGGSYLASEDPRLHFGLGEATMASDVTVRWLDGETTTLRDIDANQRVHIGR
jgi:hypothetical protein